VLDRKTYAQAGHGSMEPAADAPASG